MIQDRERFRRILDNFEKGSNESKEVGSLIDDIDSIDEIFTDVVSKDVRSEHEQFITPSEISEFMVNWCVNTDEGKLLDPAVGTGQFLSKAAETTTDLELYGFDIDPLMIRSSRIRLDKKLTNNRSVLKQRDFLDINFPEKYDYIVCNPPFKKFKEYNNTNRLDWLKARYGVEIGRQANLFVAFLIHCYNFLEEGGRGAFITPNEFLYSNYGDEVKEFMLKNFKLEAIVLLDFEDVFEDILTTPVITLFSKAKPGKTRFIRLDKWLETNQLIDTVSSEEKADNTEDQSSLNHEANWLRYFSDYKFRSSDALTEFSSIADIKRGIATGYNEYFLFTESELEDRDLSRHQFSRVVSRSSHCANLSLTDADLRELDKGHKSTYLLYHVDEIDEPLDQYLQYGRSIDAHERYLSKNRTPWYKVERREPAPILATTFSRNDMRFVLNETNARNLTAFHCVYPFCSDLKKIKALLAYLNSGFFNSIMDTQKRMHGGLGKFEPNDLKELTVLNIDSIRPPIITKLSNLFDELQAAKRSNNDRQSVIQSIDKVIENQI